jgi:hypothetical protein
MRRPLDRPLPPHEDCQDSTEDSPHGHVAFYIDVPDGRSVASPRTSVGSPMGAACSWLRGTAVHESCPNDLPPAAPGAPELSGDGRPIINLRCVTCHSPGGQEASRPLQTYSQVYSERSAVLNQVYACNMPPGTARSRRSRSGRRF